MYYCPQCGKRQVTSKLLYLDHATLINIGDGDSDIILHYECECGNKLAGCIDATDMDEYGLQKAMKLIADNQSIAANI